MVKALREWIADDVLPVRDKSVQWLSQYHFFRDPIRPIYIDPDYFFAPADGVILYQEVVDPEHSVIDVKGSAYTLREALRDDTFSQRCLVIGIFMTFYDVHINRVPYSGRLRYRELDAIDTVNRPMLDVEHELLHQLRVPAKGCEYLRHNQRMINRIDVPDLNLSYYLLQIADYDVDCIMPFELGQNNYVDQGHRFSQIRYGSQVDLIIPLSDRYEFTTLCEPEEHVEAGIDPLVHITETTEENR